MLSAGPTPAHAPGIRSRRALACPQSTYIKSQSPGSGPTASDRRTQTTSASWNLCGSGSKASAPSLPPAPSAPRPPPLARVVLTVGLGTWKGIGPRACHINWVGSPERNRQAPWRDGGSNSASGSGEPSLAPASPSPWLKSTRLEVHGAWLRIIRNNKTK